MKKSISIVIALMLLVNVFAISAFAAVPSGNAIALTLSAEDKAYAAGETVYVTLSVETTSAVSGLFVGEVEVAYDDSIFEPVSDISQGPLLSAYGCTDGTIISGNHETSLSSIKPGGDSGFYHEDEVNYGWNAGLYFGIVENSLGVNPVDCSTGPQTFLTFPIKISEGVADGTYTIGVNKCAFEEGGAFLVDEDFYGIYGGMGEDFGVGATDTFACGTLTITVGAGGGSSTVTTDVQNIATQAQWQDKNAGLMRVAFRGNVLNYVPSFAEGSTTEIDDITEMGVVYSKTVANPTAGAADCTTVQAYTLYDFTTGGYFFRAVVGNYPYNNTDTLYANAYIVIDGQTITASNAAYQTTGADVYAAAVANGMASK